MVKFDEEKYFMAAFSCGHEARVVRKNKSGTAYGAWLSSERLCPTCYAKEQEETNEQLAIEAKKLAEEWGLPPLIGKRNTRALNKGEHKRAMHMQEILQIEFKIKQKVEAGEEVPKADEMLGHINFWKQNRNPFFWLTVPRSKWKTELKLISEGELRALCGASYLESTSSSGKTSPAEAEVDSESATKSPGAQSAETTLSTSESSETRPDRESIRWSPAAMVRRTPRK